jgi:hypothetical protein
MSLLVRTSTDIGALLVQDTDDPKALAVTESTSPLALRVRESTSPLAMRVRGLFSPASLPGLAAWYDASDPATVLTTVSPDVPATDGQTVRRWVDKSGNARHMDQANLTLQPVFTNAATGLTFDGSNDFLEAPSLDALTMTQYLVYRRRTTSLGFKVILATGVSGDSNAANRFSNILVLDQAGPLISAAVANNRTTSATGNIRAIGTTRQIETLIAGVTAGSSRVNGAQYGTYVLTANAGGRTLITRIGRNTWEAPIPDSIEVQEYLFYANNHSDAEAMRVESYLARKWGITV